MADYETITVEKRGQVDWLTLNRPESLNAINTPMVTELRDYFGNLAEDAETRIVVMRGAGRAFCAGLDIKDARAGTYERPHGYGFGFQGYLAEVYIRMRRCPQPIISLVHGAACGGGFSFALASDIRVAGESAKMNAAFIKIGLSACDMGSSYFLPRLVGTSVASELMLTGRFIHADRALAPVAGDEHRALGLRRRAVAHPAVKAAGIADGRFDLNDLSAHVGKVNAGQRTLNGGAHLDRPKPGQGLRHGRRLRLGAQWFHQGRSENERRSISKVQVERCCWARW